MSFAVLYLGQHHIIGSASDIGAEHFEEMRQEIVTAFQGSRIHKVIEIMKAYFSGSNFSFFELFKDERNKVLQKILAKNMDNAAQDYKNIYNNNYNLLNVLKSADLPTPTMLQRNMEMVLNHELLAALGQDQLDLKRVRRLVGEVTKWQVPLDLQNLAYHATERMNAIYHKFAAEPTTIKPLMDLTVFLALIREIDIPADLNALQNEIFLTAKEWIPIWSQSGEEKDQKLRNTFVKLAGDVDMGGSNTSNGIEGLRQTKKNPHHSMWVFNFNLLTV